MTCNDMQPTKITLLPLQHSRPPCVYIYIYLHKNIIHTPSSNLRARWKLIGTWKIGNTISIKYKYIYQNQKTHPLIFASFFIQEYINTSLDNTSTKSITQRPTSKYHIIDDKSSKNILYHRYRPARSCVACLAIGWTT